MTTSGTGGETVEENGPVTPSENDYWVLLVDPVWQASQPQQADQEQEPEQPPFEAVMGGWLVTANGEIGGFRANAEFQPTDPNSPTDPVDATLQLLARGEIDTDSLFSVIEDSVFDVALDEDERPIVTESPDDVPCLLVTTAPAHRPRVYTDHWREELTATELSDLLQEQQVDVLFNPGGPASTRLIRDVFTENVMAAKNRDVAPTAVGGSAASSAGGPDSVPHQGI